MNFWSRWIPRRGQTIIVVSGLPRSGTSMMMKMLEAGGLQTYTDGIREADVDNPKGYFEHEKIRRLADTEDRAWLQQAQGRAIKVIAFLLKELPPENRYDVIFVDRRIEEVVASQNKMLRRRGEPVTESALETARMLQTHSRTVRLWLNRQPNFRWIQIDYSDTIRDPTTQTDRVADFLGVPLDRRKMAGVVDRSLYRNRSQSEAPAE